MYGFELEILPDTARNWFGDFLDEEGLFSGSAEEMMPVRAEEAAEHFPRVDLGETEKAYFIRAELPGFNKRDLDLVYEDGELILRGHREPENHGTRYLHSERFYGEFERRFALPEDVDPTKVQAQYRDGILTVRIPKDFSKVREVPVEE